MAGKRLFNYLRLGLTVFATCSLLAAAEHHGQVKFGGLPVPGATVLATMGDKTLSAVTDGNGAYSFPDLADGTWKVKVEMLCFSPIEQDVVVAPGAPSPAWELKLLPFDEIKASAPPPPPAPVSSSVAPPATNGTTNGTSTAAPAKTETAAAVLPARKNSKSSGVKLPKGT